MHESNEQRDMTLLIGIAIYLAGMFVGVLATLTVINIHAYLSR